MEAIFWDMDGTLIDTEPLWGRATHQLSEELGGPLSAEARRRTIGGSGPNTIRVISEHLGITLTEEEQRKAIARLGELLIGHVRADGAPLRPGARGLLDEGLAAGVPMVLVTNTVRYLADEEIKFIGAHYFAATVVGDEVPRGKPAPDPYLEAARIVGKLPGECLAVEDSFTGTSAAVAAGCRTLGVPVDDDGNVADGAGRLSALTGDVDLAGYRIADLSDVFDRLRG